ncbi:uncharacterized protein A4U43_C08F21180 [Asparagus officinalis]|uniref:uncharacterized protein LOC109819720 n=1 Tax=Asparagus officinalis TaxID=4686 RepID=UPI00098DF204|nr:uncharacterized protein LOC109819720 [Asparagus officinalis]ONK60662.1 uncharacterized protein A4U43_C08F21180 [Asparagus officinalis]
MDMEDDVSHPDADKTVDESIKEPDCKVIFLCNKNDDVKKTYPASEQLAQVVGASNTLTGSEQFLHDGEDGKGLSFLEDVSPVRQSPNTAGQALGNSVQGSVGLPTEDSSNINISAPALGRTVEAPTVYVKDGSPFRLIQGYASDDSEEDDKMDKMENAEEGDALSCLPVKATSQSAICPSVNPSNEGFDPHYHERLNDEIMKCEPSQSSGLVAADNMDTHDQVGKHQPEKYANQDSTELDVDEFGRLVRKGTSDTDSDEVHLSKRRSRRGRKRSRSRSPQESRWKHRSRSPRGREKRNRSHSWSPRRRRSKSPPAFRHANVNSRRDRDQPTECLDFKRETEMAIGEHSDTPQEDVKSIEMQDHRDQSGDNTMADNAGDFSEKDMSASKANKALPPVNDVIKRTQVTNQVSQEAVNNVETSQVEEVTETSESMKIQDPSFKSSQFLQADSMLNQSTSTGSDQPPLIADPNNVSQPQNFAQSSHEGSLPHAFENKSISPKDFQPAKMSNLNVYSQPSQQVPPGPPGPPSQPHLPSDNLSAPFASQYHAAFHPSATNYHVQPPSDIFSSSHPPMVNDYHSYGMPSQNSAWHNIPPPPSSLVMPPIHDFNPVMRPFQPGEMTRPVRGVFHQQSFHPLEPFQQPPLHVDELRRRPLLMGTSHEHPYVSQDRFPHPPLSLPREHLPNVSPSFLVEHVDVRPFSREEFDPDIKDLPSSQCPPPYAQPQNISSNYPPNMSTAGLVDPSLKRYPSSFLDKRPPHFNPFASTFEQVPAGKKYNVSGQENDMNYASKYDSPFSSGHAPVGLESTLTSSLPNSKKPSEQISPRAGVFSQKNAVSLSDAQKLVVKNPVAGDAYDPLFDSIEPSSNPLKMFDEVREPNIAVNEVGIKSKLSSLHKSADIGENSKQKGSAGGEHKSEVDEFGEVAMDAEVGVVENASPQLIDDKDWSPALPADMDNAATGEIEIDHVRSPGKSKKSKDSRSMKLFKIALADFVKEVLKPSWRQGNMSKEAFKTIVKKTVDKVSGAMASHQIPKSQAKINQYVESSQRKLTKLVMGYVDKYVKV